MNSGSTGETEEEQEEVGLDEEVDGEDIWMQEEENGEVAPESLLNRQETQEPFGKVDLNDKEHEVPDSIYTSRTSSRDHCQMKISARSKRSFPGRLNEKKRKEKAQAQAQAAAAARML